jgi:alpha-L-arabinofuranosidase
VADGAYRQGDEAVGLSYFGDENWSDYTLTLKARKLHGAEGFLVVFGRQGRDKYWWNIGGWGNHEHAIEFNQTPVGSRVAGSVETNRWYAIRIEVRGRRIRCFLDGELVHDVTAPRADHFFASAGRDAASGDLVLKVINVSPQPVTAQIAVNGAAGLASQGSVTVLSGDRLDQNNSLDDPFKIVPVAASIDGVGSSFPHQFPANSFSVLRLKTR